MSKPELTKRLMADTLRELMQDMPLDKISIRSLVKACGLNRKTFYYHFQDKQALICWIFDSEFANLTDVDANNTIIDELIEHLHNNKDFYVAALTSDVQNNLSDHLFRVMRNSLFKEIGDILDGRPMSVSQRQMISDYFSHAIIGTIVKWAREGMVIPPSDFHSSFYTMTRECLEFVVSQHVMEK